jgi:salicylate hydroxylase
VSIVGGGIGGLTAALAFARHGFAVRLFEQAPAFGDIGAGIQLSPNCTRVLHELGLEGALRAVAFVPDGIEMREWNTGRVLSMSPLGGDALRRFGAPYYHVHRADLVQLLVEAARASNDIELTTDARVEGIAPSADGVSFQAGATHVVADLLVGADGIHSTVRSALFGHESPRFTGNVAWRALVPVQRLAPGLVRPMATAWWGPHRHFVHYYVRAGTLVNCVCVVEKRGWEKESWTERGEHAELARDFAGWHPTVTTLIENMDRDACFKWALFDRPPMPTWSAGRITLLGDACHPTLPFMAQGAAMAIEDAAVLAQCVASVPDIPSALVRYEDLRRERTARIQAGSRRNARVFHMTGINAWLRNRAVAAGRGPALTWVYEYDPLTVT